MVEINLVGTDFFGHSGYGRHSRSLFNALWENNSDIYLDIPVQPGFEALANDAEFAAITKTRYPYGVTFMIAQPHWWPAGMVEPHKKFVGCCVWEGDTIPKHFLPHLNKADLVVAPSEHTKRAIHALDKDLKIVVVPHGVDTALFKVQEKKEGQPFTFVANKGWAKGIHDRGGIQYLFKAFAEEFGKDETVQLRVKINPAYCPPGWNLQVEMNKLKLPEDRPKIHISLDNVDYKKMPSFYRGDVFVSPTKAEAFNLPCLEAMSCGLPVIATDFGGQTDFVNEENGWLIPYKLEEVKNELAYEGIKWATPNNAELRKAMRRAFENREEVAAKALKAREKAEEYTWRKAAQKLTKALEEINE